MNELVKYYRVMNFLIFLFGVEVGFGIGVLVAENFLK